MTHRDFDTAFQSIMAVFRAHGVAVKTLPEGFRLQLIDGYNVDIYPPKDGSPYAVARIGPAEWDGEINTAEISQINRMLAKYLADMAVIRRFKPSDDPGDAFFNYLRIDMSETPVYHETIVIDDQSADPEIRNMTSLVEEAVSRLETVDPGMFRQAMDRLALPRSGNLRMVLSRLYRSAMDAGELSAAAEKEAEKITRPSEIEALERIRNLPSVEFLFPLIELLWQKMAEKNPSIST